MPAGPERRKHPRLVSKTSSASRFAGAGAPKLPAAAEVADISEGGVRLAFPWPEGVRFPVKAGDDLKFDLKVEGCERAFAAGGVVRRVSLDEESGLTWVGIEFRDLGAEDRRALKEALMGLAVAKLRDVSSGSEPAALPAGSTARPPGGRRAPFEAAPAAAAAAPPPAARKRRKLFIGEILVKQGAISAEKIDELLASRKGDRRPLGQKLIAEGLIDEVSIAKALAEQARLPFIDLITETPDLKLTSALPRLVFANRRCLPMRDEGTSLLVAMKGSPELPVVEELEQAAGKRIRVGIAPEHKLDQWLKRIYNVEGAPRRSDLRFPVRLNVGYRFLEPVAGAPLQREFLTGFTEELSSHGLVLAGPLPAGLDPERIMVEAFRMEVQVECAEVLNEITLFCRPLSVQHGREPGLYLISSAIERFPEGGVPVWERLCMVASTIRFRPRSGRV